jgi:hypothetical protein
MKQFASSEKQDTDVHLLRNKEYVFVMHSHYCLFISSPKS